MSGSNLCVGGLWVGLIPGVARREQGAIAAKISNVQVQDYLPAEADTGQAGDHGTLHPGAISAVWRFSALNHHKPEKCSFHAET